MSKAKELLEMYSAIGYMESNSIDNVDLGVEHQDSGQFRSYELSTHGASEEEMIKNATVSEVDQDGGEIKSYGLDKASNEVEAAAMKLIKSELGKSK
jgi:hypothetical protein